jgi:hypothetical protein
MANTNPLAQYFRTPGVHQAIPTGGQFFGEGEIDLAINGEVAVLPMTAGDEIILKNPDALLNGDALERLFRSCVPAIKNPRKISVPDLDVLLLAIKLASFGDALEINVTCPKCKKEFETAASIRGLLSTVREIDPMEAVVRISDEVVVNVRPYDFESKTKLDLATFEEAKLYQYLVDAEMDDAEKTKRFNQSFEKIAGLNLDLIAECITKVSVPDADVMDPEFIREFIRNSDKNSVKLIRDCLAKLSDSGIEKEMDMVCPNEECQHEWKTPLVFDPSHFFE